MLAKQYSTTRAARPALGQRLDCGFIPEEKLLNQCPLKLNRTQPTIQKGQSKHVSEQSKMFFKDKRA